MEKNDFENCHLRKKMKPKKINKKTRNFRQIEISKSKKSLFSEKKSPKKSKKIPQKSMEYVCSNFFLTIWNFSLVLMSGANISTTRTSSAELDGG